MYFAHAGHDHAEEATVKSAQTPAAQQSNSLDATFIVAAAVIVVIGAAVAVYFLRSNKSKK